MDQVNDTEIDKLYQEAEGVAGPTADIPMQAAAEPVIPEIEFTAGGKAIKTKFDDPKLKTWLSAGYDAPNQIGQLNQKLKANEEQLKKYADYETKYAPYKQVDEWALKNPDQWKTIEQLWKEKTTAAHNPDGTVAQLPPEIIQTIDQLKADREERLIREKEESRKTADSNLDREIESIKAAWPNLDFDSKPEGGKSLLAKVLDHGAKNNLPSFATAFKDYYFDEAVKAGQEKGKEQVTKTIQKNSRLGLLGKTPDRKTSDSNAVDLSGLSMDQVHRRALEELGLG